jgi:hypothetical protein
MFDEFTPESLLSSQQDPQVEAATNNRMLLLLLCFSAFCGQGLENVRPTANFREALGESPSRALRHESSLLPPLLA